MQSVCAYIDTYAHVAVVTCTTIGFLVLLTLILSIALNLLVLAWCTNVNSAARASTFVEHIVMVVPLSEHRSRDTHQKPGSVLNFKAAISLEVQHWPTDGWLREVLLYSHNSCLYIATMHVYHANVHHARVLWQIHVKYSTKLNAI